MANNTFETFQGKAHWNSLTHTDKFGKFSIKLYLDQQSKEKFQDMQATLGIMTKLMKDDDGYYATFARPREKEYGQGSKAKKIIFDPPTVVERDGTTPFIGKIGHGSDVTLTCEVYPYTIPASGGKKGKALRLSAVRVDNLVPFDTQEHGDEQALRNIAPLASASPQPRF